MDNDHAPVIATYRLRGTRDHADGLVDAIRAGRQVDGVHPLEETDEGCFSLTLEYAAAGIGRDLTQLVNVLLGEATHRRGVRLIDLALPPPLLAAFKGPRYGAKGLAQLVGGAGRPLLCGTLGPIGASPEQLAYVAHCYARGGIDIIVEPAGLTDPPFAPFAERVQLCTRAVRKGNKESGRSAMFVPNVTAPAHAFYRRAHLAATLGAGGIQVAPGLMGWDTVRVLAEDDNLGLPVLTHPTMLGGFTLHRDEGIEPGVLHGQLARLAGADGVLLDNPADPVELLEHATTAMGRIRACMPLLAHRGDVAGIDGALKSLGSTAGLLLGDRMAGDWVERHTEEALT